MRVTDEHGKVYEMKEVRVVPEDWKMERGSCTPVHVGAHPGCYTGIGVDREFASLSLPELRQLIDKLIEHREYLEGGESGVLWSWITSKSAPYATPPKL